MTIFNPTTLLVPPGSSGVQIPISSGGASLINFGNETVYLVPTQDLIGNVNSAAPVVRGAAIPWPRSVTCYAFVASTTPGSIYISPIQSSVFPIPQTVTIGNTPLPIAEYTGTDSVGTSFSTSGVVLGGLPSNQRYRLLGADLSNGFTTTGATVEILDHASTVMAILSAIESSGIPAQVPTDHVDLSGFITSGPVSVSYIYGSGTIGVLRATVLTFS